jgi:hypothetical protein
MKKIFFTGRVLPEIMNLSIDFETRVCTQ